jgi:hypothetical protein
MKPEKDLHESMFPELDSNPEMYRRLQVRVNESIIRVMEDQLTQLFPRNYYMLSNNNFVETGEELFENLIPICASQYKNNSYQVLLMRNCSLIEVQMTNEVKVVHVPDNLFYCKDDLEKEYEIMSYLRHVLDI